MGKTLTPRELAIQRGWSLDWVYRQLAVGKYTGAMKVGKSWRIPVDAVKTHEEARENVGR